jgi:hypothetical protein
LGFIHVPPTVTERLNSAPLPDQRQSPMMTLSSQNECPSRIGITIRTPGSSPKIHPVVIKLTSRNKPLTIGSK